MKNRNRAFIAGIGILLGVIVVPAAVVAPAANAAVFACYQGNTQTNYGPGRTYSFNRGNYCITRTFQGVTTDFVFQGDGNLVKYRNGSPTWASNTAQRGFRFALQADGNAVIYDSYNFPVWASNTNSASSQARTLWVSAYDVIITNTATNRNLRVF